MKLVDFVQMHLDDAPGGGSDARRPKNFHDEAARQALREVQRRNELYFRLYWMTLLAAFIATFVIAIVLREEMGGLAVVLGAGGVVQGGLVLRLSSELKEKMRIDIVIALCERLDPKDLQVVLKEMLPALRK